MQPETQRALDKVLDKAHKDRERRREAEPDRTEYGVEWWIDDGEHSHWTMYQGCSDGGHAIARAKFLNSKHPLHMFRPVVIRRVVEVIKP